MQALQAMQQPGPARPDGARGPIPARLFEPLRLDKFGTQAQLERQKTYRNIFEHAEAAAAAAAISSWKLVEAAGC